MNTTRQKAILTPETPESHFCRGFDLCTGDVVQVRAPGHNAGRLGTIIGITYYGMKDDLRFTVQFSNREAAVFTCERLQRVSPSRDRGR